MALRGPGPLRGPQSPDDVVMGIALTTTWMLATGRRLRCGVPLFHDLAAPELVDFWADDHIEPTPENTSGGTERPDHDLTLPATGCHAACPRRLLPMAPHSACALRDARCRHHRLRPP
jgi:hypothetical protein